MFDAPADITAGGDLAARRAARRKRNSVHVSAPAKYAAPDAYYELKQLLGQGAFAEVWRAQDKVADRKMAVKLYKKRSLKHDHIQMLVQQEIECVGAVCRCVPRPTQAHVDLAVRSRAVVSCVR
mgnify:CR=1 FL=1